MISALDQAYDTLAGTRPTAVNLFWALEKMKAVWQNGHANDPAGLAKQLVQKAMSLHEEDLQSCHRIGEFGAALLSPKSIVLTHCNAGALATAGHGTALGVIRTAHQKKKIKKVFVDETRPYLQGARLTAWELHQGGIPYEVITDNMAGHMMKTEKISAVIVGADRIAANGDTANKIGTYSLAILAKHHHIPFYIAAPFSTIDLNIPDGSHIPIEERSEKEVAFVGKTHITPKGAKIRHPAFDVTPAALITAIMTERGVIEKSKFKTLNSKS